MKKGQIALAVLVVSAIVMTVGLSLSKKSVVDTKINTDEELLKQAFNAAESGIEYYLGTGATSFTTTDGQSVANVKVRTIGGDSNLVNLGGITLRNTNNNVWLAGHNEDGSLDMGTVFGATAMSVCVDNDFNGSLMVSYFYKDGADYKVYRSGYNVDTADLVSGFSNLVGSLPSCPGVSGMKEIVLSLPWGGGRIPILLVVKPMADDSRIAVAVAPADQKFPEQGTEINSVGRAGDVSGSSGVQVNREVTVINQYQIPSFMLEAVTATGNVLSN